MEKLNVMNVELFGEIFWNFVIIFHLTQPGPPISQNESSSATRDVRSTHAWAEVYVPSAGWITFDPTSRSIGGFNLISVVVARGIRQAMPVTGSFVGMTDAFLGMSVEVLVTSYHRRDIIDGRSIDRPLGEEWHEGAGVVYVRFAPDADNRNFCPCCRM